LESLELSGADPRSQLEIVHRSARTRGLVAFFSDLWDERLREPLLSCTSAGDLVVLHVLSPSERVPEAWGRVRIADAESGEELERFVGPEEVRKYQELLHEQCEAWRGWCLEHGISYVRFGSETPWIDVVTVTLREAGVVEGWD